MKRMIIPYNPALKELARQLRNNSTKSEIMLWKYLKNKQLCGYDFDRQKPLLNFIADFYSYELKLVIELDGYTHQFEETVEKDRIKTEELEAIGLTVLRFEDKAIFENMSSVLRVLEDYILAFEEGQKGHTPSPSQ